MAELGRVVAGHDHGAILALADAAHSCGLRSAQATRRPRCFHGFVHVSPPKLFFTWVRSRRCVRMTTRNGNCLSRRRWERRGRAKLGCGEGSGRLNRANEACRAARGPLCDQASAWPRLPHFVGETRTPPVAADQPRIQASWERQRPRPSPPTNRGFTLRGKDEDAAESAKGCCYSPSA